MLLQGAEDPWQMPLDFLCQLVALVLLVLLAMVLLLLLLVTLVATVMLLLLMTLVTPVVLLLSAVVLRRPRAGSHGFAALEVDVDPALVLLVRVVPQAQLPAELLDLGLQLLHAARRVVALADDGEEVVGAAGLVGADALLEDALCLLDELPVQVDLILIDAARRVVLAEDVLGRLAVKVVHLGVVRLALVRKLLRAGAVAGLVGLL